MYINTGTYAVPVWTKLERISDVKLPKSRPSSRRAYRGLNSSKNVTGYLDFGISFKYEHKKVGQIHAAYDLLQDSLLNDTPLDCLNVNAPLVVPTDHPLAGEDAVGFRGYYNVVKLDRDEADEDGTTSDVELKEVYEEVSGVPKEVVAFSQEITEAA
jgi:hypothetical protein